MLDKQQTLMIDAARDRSMASPHLSIEQLSSILGVSTRSIRRWSAHGSGPARVKRGRRFMYLRSDVTAWLNATPHSVVPHV